LYLVVKVAAKGKFPRGSKYREGGFGEVDSGALARRAGIKGPLLAW